MKKVLLLLASIVVSTVAYSAPVSYVSRTDCDTTYPGYCLYTFRVNLEELLIREPVWGDELPRYWNAANQDWHNGIHFTLHPEIGGPDIGGESGTPWYDLHIRTDETYTNLGYWVTKGTVPRTFDVKQWSRSVSTPPSKHNFVGCSYKPGTIVCDGQWMAIHAVDEMIKPPLH